MFKISQINSAWCSQRQSRSQLAGQLHIAGIITMPCLIGFFFLLAATIVASKAPYWHYLIIQTAGGQVEVLIGEDRWEVEDIADAIGEAIIGQE